MNATNIVKIKSLKLDKAIYQTIATLQKSSGFLEWEPISRNVKGIWFNYRRTVSQGTNLRLVLNE